MTNEERSSCSWVQDRSRVPHGHGNSSWRALKEDIDRSNRELDRFDFHLAPTDVMRSCRHVRLRRRQDRIENAGDRLLLVDAPRSLAPGWLRHPDHALLCRRHRTSAPDQQSHRCLMQFEQLPWYKATVSTYDWNTSIRELNRYLTFCQSTNMPLDLQPILGTGTALASSTQLNLDTNGNIREPSLLGSRKWGIVFLSGWCQIRNGTYPMFTYVRQFLAYLYLRKVRHRRVGWLGCPWMKRNGAASVACFGIVGQLKLWNM
jgi:hypothetical protein